MKVFLALASMVLASAFIASCRPPKDTRLGNDISTNAFTMSINFYGDFITSGNKVEQEDITMPTLNKVEQEDIRTPTLNITPTLNASNK